MRLIMAVLAATSLVTCPAVAEESDIEKAGDFFAVALPVSAYAGTWIADDWGGTVMFTKSLGATVVTTSVKKFKIRGQIEAPRVS